MDRTNIRHGFPLPVENPVEPSPLWEDFRAGGEIPVVQLPSGEPAYLLTRYREVREALVNPAFSRAAVAGRRDGLVSLESTGTSIVDLDPPGHTRLRKLITGAFTPKHIQWLRPQVEERAAELLAAMLEAGPPADFVAAFADPFALAVVCGLLGVPVDDASRFRGWAVRIMSLGREEDTGSARAREEFFTYLRGLADGKRSHRRDDLFTALVAAHDADPARFSEAELVTMVAVLVVGGLSPANFLSRGLPWLLRSPELFQQFGSAPPARLDELVEELVRVVTQTETAVPRMAVREVELSGTTIPAGSLVIPGLSSANHDDAEFPDAGAFDEHRPDRQRHLAFGAGPHYCVGAPLARLELGIALSTLARRVPTLRLAVPEAELHRHTGTFTQNIAQLPVTWDRA